MDQQLARKREVPLASPFKALVAELRLFLAALSAGLDAEDGRLASPDGLVDEAARMEVVSRVAPLARSHLRACFSELGQMVAGWDGEQHQAHHAYFQSRLRRLFTDETVFFRRAQLKPLGYAGDYEMMNLIYEERMSAPSSFGRVVDLFGYQTTACQAVRNRIPYLSRRVLELLAPNPAARFASVACGPAHEVKAMLAQPSGLWGRTVTLVDAEAEAIRYCERTIVQPNAGRDVDVRLLPVSIRELVGGRLSDRLVSQDVVISVGLFDYFDDRLFRRMLKALYRLLEPGGHLLVGNFDHTNDTRPMMEFAMEWYLHYRSAAELRALCADLPEMATVEIEAEPLGVNLFLHVTKPA